MKLFKMHKYFFHIIACGGEISAPGIIKSPISASNMGKYPNDANCTWIIRAPPNQVVWLVYV
jgi:hypothetical protein